MDIRLFHKRLLEAARELIPPGSLVVCGVSGGADSMVLLHGLHELGRMQARPGRDAWRLHVAHLDHGQRADSAADAEFVREAAADLKIACTVETADVREARRRSGQTLEEAARRLRYYYLERLARSLGARVVAVGHHADDQAETVLHHIARGTGLRGLAGMPARRPITEGSEIELVRPLLGMRRAELRAYLEQRKRLFREDPTNKDLSGATRNRIRHQILPLIEQTVNPALTAALVRLATQARRADEAIQAMAGEALNRIQVQRSDDAVTLCAEAMAALPRIVQTEVILIVLRRLGAGLKAVGFERIEAAADLASGGGERRTVQIPGGVRVSRRGGELHIHRAELPKPRALGACVRPARQ